jgi:heme-degrading monooxygenase HmoA
MPSASINPGASPITLINVFTVAPDKQDELVRLLSEATEKAMKRLPGFVSANIHKSLDGTRVVNYAQWRSKDDFEAMLKNPEAAPHMKSGSSNRKVRAPPVRRRCRAHGLIVLIILPEGWGAAGRVCRVCQPTTRP